MNSTRDSIGDDLLNQGMLLSEDDTLWVDTRRDSDGEIKSSTAKLAPKIVGDEILVDRYDVSTIKATASSTHSGSKPEMENENLLVVESICKSRMWPALQSLDDTLSTPDMSVKDEDDARFRRLSEQFSYSPRNFTETLITIIEESFNSSYDALQHPSQSSPIDAPQPDVSDNESPICGLEKKNLPGVAFVEDRPSQRSKSHSPKASSVDELGQHESPQTIANFTPSETRAQSNPANPASDASADESTRYLRIPEIKVTPSTTDDTTNSQTVSKTPSIYVNPPTPPIAIPKSRRIQTPYRKLSSKKVCAKASKDRCELKNYKKSVARLEQSPCTSPLNSDDDEYLTADSETEESELSRETSSRSDSAIGIPKTSNISAIRSGHEEWLRKFKQIENSDYSFVTQGSPAVTAKKTKFNEYAEKLKKRLIKDLQAKRRRCLDLVEEAMRKPVVERPQDESCSIDESPLANEFFKVILACYDFMESTKKAREICHCQQNAARRYVTTATVTLKTKSDGAASTATRKTRKSLSKSPSPGIVAASPKIARSPVYSRTRKSLGLRATVRTSVKSPGARLNVARTSLSAQTAINRGVSKKRGGSPAVDVSSIRPVSQLRKVFSPDTKTTGCLQSKESNGKKPTTAKKPSSTEKKPTSKFVAKPLPLVKIVSPVAEYIRGKKTT